MATIKNRKGGRREETGKETKEEEPKGVGSQMSGVSIKGVTAWWYGVSFRSGENA